MFNFEQNINFMHMNQMSFSYPFCDIVYPFFTNQTSQIYYNYIDYNQFVQPIETQANLYEQSIMSNIGNQQIQLNQMVNIGENLNQIQKKENNQDRIQKTDRNFNSILLRSFASYIHNHPKLIELLEKMIIRKKLKTIEARTYLQSLQQVLPSQKAYVGVGKLKRFLQKGKQNSEKRILTLVLLKKFIHIQYFLMILNSRKISFQIKEKELKHGKRFLNQLLKSFY